MRSLHFCRRTPAMALVGLGCVLGGCLGPPPVETVAGYRMAPGNGAQPPDIVADACAGPPTLVVRGNWPELDPGRQRLLPFGCAAAAGLAAELVNPQDLLHGRPLAPGAATPFAEAVEKYYRRNETTRPINAGDGTGGGSDLNSLNAPLPQAGGLPANPLLAPNLAPAP
jgi:hypothetical protein